MYKIYLIAQLLFLLASAITHYEHEDLNFLQDLWETWKSHQNKIYPKLEDSARFNTFVENYHKVNQFNSVSTSLKLSLNKFADLTTEEFTNIHSSCGYSIKDSKESQASVPLAQFPNDIEKNLDSVDWRKMGIVTPVKNQGQCGACWTFSATGALESFYAINTGILKSFSEQQIVDCAANAGKGCAGGWTYSALQYAGERGLQSEIDYPYLAQDGTCNYNADKAQKVNTGAAFITSNKVKSFKSALKQRPISAAINANAAVIHLYGSGVISAKSDCPKVLTHAVLVVGYEIIYGEEAFIVKNSWGSNWGEDGYVYISTDKDANGGAGVCGILSEGFIPV